MSPDSKDPKKDYKDSVFLPRTDFPLKAGLAAREPETLAFWESMDLAGALRTARASHPPFILHDGPPYANGHLHIGHALNKILKDIINRSRSMLGQRALYVPGWDCHGLPIEWKIEEKYRAAGKNKDDVPVLEFRRECREFAASWIDIQRAEFKRLGVMGSWDNPYTTMTHAAEAQIVRELGKFLLNGSLYRGAKPVMWSVVEKTALAEAEVEYHDHTSTQVWVGFPVASSPRKELAGAKVVIWTTTPWTLPGNRAVAYGADIDYVVIAAEGAPLVVAKERLADFLQATGLSASAPTATLTGRDLAGTILRHPLHGQGYDFDVPMVAGFHVTTEAGTGFVHIAPGHGAEDFQIGQENGIEVPQTVGPDGNYYDHVPLFAGKHVYKVDPLVADALGKAGHLLAQGKLTHSYPHSWRSKAPLIFRTTPQWFISMETNGLRAKALEAIARTRWVPATGRNRIEAMVSTRPDWCVSRQRAWGVPITVFTSKKTGEPLRDARVLERIAAAVEKEGADAWFSGDPLRFLAPEHKADDYEAVFDILDVWFDSGSTHAFVLEQFPGLAAPADLYLEGSDQHRGWFQSSLLESCGTRGAAPFKAVLTHGFVLDEQGRKMSKSMGNVVSPQDVTKDYGADILRLWVATSDYTEDLRIGPDILKHQADAYRRLRNTLRYLLGSLAGFEDSERVAVDQMPELERWVLHRLAELDALMRKNLESFNFHGFFTALHNFCAVDLSAFYFDIRKDCLYCDRRDDPPRRAARSVLDILFSALSTWLAPVLCFTAEEVWQTRRRESPSLSGPPSVHLALYPAIPASWHNAALGEKWDRLRDVRRVITGALELARAEKRIGSSLQAAPVLYGAQSFAADLAGLDMAEIAITSALRLSNDAAPSGAFTLADVPGLSVVVELASGEKCARCWKVLPTVTSAGLCPRCEKAVSS